MMHTLKYMAGVVIAAIAISSCDEETMTIGQSLTNKNDQLYMDAATFPISTRTIVADSVFSLAGDCYFGKVRDPETGSDVTSEFTTQFHLLETTYISPETDIVNHYDGRAAADSCAIELYLSSPLHSKDSLTAMKMRVTEMSSPMMEGTRYYSSFDPKAEGMIRQNGLMVNKVFTYEDLTLIDSVRYSSTHLDNIHISLNKPYTAVDGTTYNNYGSYLMRQYYDHPEYYRNSYTFTHNICPGFFFEITDGLGFHAKVSDIAIRVYTTVKGDSTDYKGTLTLAGTKEVLQTTHIKNDREALLAMAQETGYTYLKTPAGLFTELTIPVEDIKRGHEADSILAAKVTFQRLNNMSTDDRMLGIPQRLLMVQKDSLYSFFENNKVPNNKTSFYTGYNNSSPVYSTSSSNNNTYTFNNISNLVTTLWIMKQEGEKTDPQWTSRHPDWNKMVLVPITYDTSSSGSTISNVQHDMSLTSIRLVGGANNQHAPVELSVVYGNFK